MRSLEMRIFAPSVISTRVVPTSVAPATVEIDAAYVSKVKRKVRSSNGNAALTKGVEQQLPLESYKSVEPKENNRGRYAIDVCFASIGWVTIDSRTPCSVAPYAVQGSLWAKREPPLYPSNLAQKIDEDGDMDSFVIDDDDRKMRLANAAREGKDYANRRREEKEAGDFGPGVNFGGKQGLWDESDYGIGDQWGQFPKW